jgi:hypothetical protein
VIYFPGGILVTVRTISTIGAGANSSFRVEATNLNHRSKGHAREQKNHCMRAKVVGPLTKRALRLVPTEQNTQRLTGSTINLKMRAYHCSAAESQVTSPWRGDATDACVSLGRRQWHCIYIRSCQWSGNCCVGRHGGVSMPVVLCSTIWTLDPQWEQLTASCIYFSYSFVLAVPPTTCQSVWLAHQNSVNHLSQVDWLKK